MPSLTLKRRPSSSASSSVERSTLSAPTRYESPRRISPPVGSSMRLRLACWTDCKRPRSEVGDEAGQRNAVAHAHRFDERSWSGVCVSLRFVEDQRRVQNAEAAFVEVEADRCDTGLPGRQL